MELLWKELELDRYLKSACLQIPVEGDIPLPEGRSCTAVLCLHAEVETWRCVCAEGTLRVTGSVRVALLCEDGATAGTEAAGSDAVFAFVSRAEFTAAQSAEGASDAYCVCALREPAVRIADGRLTLRATVEAQLLLLDRQPLRTLADISGLPGNDLQCRDSLLKTVRRIPVCQTTLRLREEARLAAAEADAVMLALGDVQLQDIQCDPRAGTVGVEGLLSFTALLRSRAGRLSHSLQSVPFRETLEVDANGPLCADCRLQELYVRSVGEDFGILAVEATLLLTLYRQESAEVHFAADAYAPSCPFRCENMVFTAIREAGAAEIKHSFSQAVAVPEGMPEVAQVLYAACQGVITAYGVDAETGRLSVEGILESRIAYMSANGGRYAFAEETPFTLSGEAAGDLALPELNVLLCAAGTGRSVELRFALHLRAALFETARCEAVVGIVECEAEKARPGLVICFAGAGETLYDIAKRYHITQAALQAANPALSEAALPLAEGQRVVMLL